MGFIDSLKDKIQNITGQPAYDDYDPAYDEDGYEDVSGVRVVPRGGHGASSGVIPLQRQHDLRPPTPHRGAYSTPSMFSHAGAKPGMDHERDPRLAQYYIDEPGQGPITGARTPVSDAAAMPRVEARASHEPVFLMKPESYSDVEQVVAHVRAGKAVALVLQGVKIDVSRRILDFSYGFAVGFGGRVERVADRVFVVLPKGRSLTEQDHDKMKQAGLIK